MRPGEENNDKKKGLFLFTHFQKNSHTITFVRWIVNKINCFQDCLQPLVLVLALARTTVRTSGKEERKQKERQSGGVAEP